jgi:hypothetical protein
VGCIAQHCGDSISIRLLDVEGVEVGFIDALALSVHLR